MKNRIIIAGKAGSGKNLVATLLEDEWLNLSLFTRAEIAAFADPIKNMVMQMFPNTDRQILWGNSELRATKIEGTNKTYRDLLCDLGKLGRSYLNDIWVNSILSFNSKDDYYLFIVADARFISELEIAKNKGYFLIRIIRPENIHSSDEKLLKDISETNLDSVPNSYFDAVIINDGTKEQLKQKVAELFRLYINPTKSA